MLLINQRSGASRGILSTRRGTALVAVAVALGAGLVLLLFLKQYRDSVAAEGAPARVLVANGLIAKGSSGDTLAEDKMFRVENVRENQLEPGALTDSASIRGAIAAQDIVPGQQLTNRDFVLSPGDIRTKLAGDERAFAIASDQVRTLNGALRVGDRVDLLAGFNVQSGGTGRAVVKPLLSNVLVLNPGTGQGSSVILRLPGRDVARVAFAASNGQIWLALRPGAGAKDLPAYDAASVEQALTGASAGTR